MENMQGKLIEILIFLMSEIKNRGMEEDRMEILSGELMDRGYSEQEISTAFSWILERIAAFQDEISPNPKSFRVLHDIERVFISPDAYGYLLQLSSLGLLTSNELEKVIERALMISNPWMEVNEIKSVVVDVLFEDNDMFGLDSDDFKPDDIVQ